MALLSTFFRGLQILHIMCTGDMRTDVRQYGWLYEIRRPINDIESCCPQKSDEVCCRCYSDEKAFALQSTRPGDPESTLLING